MPDLTSEQLAALARSGSTNREIFATIGREMTEAERTVVDRARVVGRLNKMVRKTGRPTIGDRAMTAAERVAKGVATRGIVERRPPADPARRARLEAAPAEWLRYYLSDAYPRPWERAHLAIIEGAIHASDMRGRFAVVAERGIGKSTLLWGLILFLKLTCRQNFPVCLPWSAQPMKRAFRFWRTALCFNKRLAADYPEFTAPFEHARGIAQRLPSLVWSDNGASCGALLQCGDGMIVMPDNRGVIGGSTINGNPKGLNYPQEDGTVLRPTLALIDDVQDRKTSKSADLIAETICKIDGDVAGLGEAGEDFALLISGNCSAPRDVMAHYLADDGWQSVRIPCVEVWPTGFDDRASECRRRWEEWRQIFLHDEGEALKFYSEHAAVMTAGMRLSAPSCYKVTKTTPDPYYGAMRSYYKMGHAAFYAEKQQEPIDEGHAAGPYNLTWEHVAMHYLPGRKFLELPAAAKTVVLASDLNEYGIHSVCCGFGNDLTGWVPWYNRMDNDGKGVVDPGVPEPEAKKQMFEALVQMGKQVAALAVATEGASTLSRPSLWLIDAGYMGDVVRRFLEGPGRTIGVQVMAARGFNASKYKPYGVQLIGRPREQCHLTESAIVGRFIGFNADYWREVSQKAWLSSPDAPGSLSLYQPGPAHHHQDFAQQVTRERLIDKSPHKITGQTEWTWATMPGRHDYGDALTMCYVAAAWGGIGTGGAVSRPVRPSHIVRDRAPRRQASVPMDAERWG